MTKCRIRVSFTEDEEWDLRNNYPEGGWRACKVCIANGRDYKTIYNKAVYMGLHKTISRPHGHRRWTDAEIEDVKNHYEYDGYEGCKVAQAAGRSEAAVKRMARSLGIDRIEGYTLEQLTNKDAYMEGREARMASRHVKWTDEEKTELNMLYESGGTDACKICRRRHTRDAIRMRASDLGLKYRGGNATNLEFKV